jgi:hypothetical protein
MRRAWTRFRGWPNAAQGGIVASLAILAIVLANLDPPMEIESGSPATVLSTTTIRAGPTTTEFVLPTASTTSAPPSTTRPAATAVPRTTLPPITEAPETVETVPDTVPERVPDPVGDDCSEYYPGVCIPSYPPDLDCPDITYRRFQVVQPDPHGFDGNDNDGIGCESG